MKVLDWLSSPEASRRLSVLERGEWNAWSFTELATASHRVNGALGTIGVGRDSRVVIALDSGAPLIATIFAAWLRGAIATPIAPPSSAIGGADYTSHIGRVVAALSPTVVVAERAHVETILGSPDVQVQGAMVVAVEELLCADADDSFAAEPSLAIMQLTSGATGPPKIVRIPPATLDANIGAIRTWLQWSPDDVGATWLPMHHDMGLIGMLTSVTTMASGYLMQPSDFIRRPVEWLRCFGEFGATVSAAPPFGLEHVVRRVKTAQLEEFDFARWRALIVGAERVPARVLARFAQFLAPHGFGIEALCPAFGLAETTVACTASAVDRPPTVVMELGGRPRPLTVDDVDAPVQAVVGCGRPLQGMDVAVVGDDGLVVADGEVGSVVVRGSSVAAGYGTPEDEARVDFSGEFDTRDMAFVVDSELFVLGRGGDAIRMHGQAVVAEDVEFAIAGVSEVPARRYCVALGQDVGPPTVVVMVERRLDERTIEAISAAARHATGNAAEVVVIASGGLAIPRTTSGKPRRREIWRAYLEGLEEQRVWDVQ